METFLEKFKLIRILTYKRHFETNLQPSIIGNLVVPKGY